MTINIRITYAKECGKVLGRAGHWSDCLPTQSSDSLERCKAVVRVQPLMVMMIMLIMIMVMMMMMMIVMNMIMIMRQSSYPLGRCKA